MNSGQWTRLSALFGELLEVAETERRVRLADPGLRADLGPELVGELERMLAAHADGLIARSEQVIEGLPLDGAGKEVFRAIGRFMVDRTT
mgnify:CR=1 FL=1